MLQGIFVHAENRIRLISIGLKLGHERLQYFLLLFTLIALIPPGIDH